jgi:hypothetical protein
MGLASEPLLQRVRAFRETSGSGQARGKLNFLKSVMPFDALGCAHIDTILN